MTIWTGEGTASATPTPVVSGSADGGAIVVPAQGLQVPEDSVVTMAAYARHIQACECGFFGVVNGPECTYDNGCSNIWTMDQRDWVQYYLAEAQYEIEEVIKYNIGQRWVVDEEHSYSNPIITTLGYVVSGGVETTADLYLSQAASHATDPVVIGPLVTTVTDVNAIQVYHPGSDIRIVPSKIAISGGSVTITIPRCRMVKPSLCDNSTAGLSYTDTNNFSATVDIKHIYNTNTTPATLVYRSCQTSTECTDTETTACIYVHDATLGIVSVVPNYITSLCGSMDRVKLSYLSGRLFANEKGYLTRWGRQAQDTIIRLAHAKMPHAPCACDAATQMWTRDREIIVDGFGRSVRGISPFGPEEGAWAAYTFCSAPGMELVRGAIL